MAGMAEGGPRGGENAETFLATFNGIVQVDGYQDYNRLTRPSQKGGEDRHRPNSSFNRSARR